MKKIIVIGLALVLVAAGAAGCGGKDRGGSGGPLDIEVGDEDNRGAVDENTGGGDGNGNEGGPQGLDWKEAYAPIFLAYEDGIETGFEGMGYEPEYLCYALATTIISITQYRNDFDGVSDRRVVYALADIDADGIPELMLGESWTYNNRQFLNIYDIWALSNDKPKRLIVRQLGETDSSGLFVSTKGYICDTNVGDVSGYTVYSIDAGKGLVQSAAFGCDPSGAQVRYTMDSKEISQDEYVRGLESFGFQTGLSNGGYYSVYLQNPDLGWLPLFEDSSLAPVPRPPTGGTDGVEFDPANITLPDYFFRDWDVPKFIADAEAAGNTVYENRDGTLSYILPQAQYQKLLKTNREAIDGQIADMNNGMYPEIVEVKANADYSDILVFCTENILAADNNAISAVWNLAADAVGFQIYLGREYDSRSTITIIDARTNQVFGTQISPDDIFLE